MLKLLAPGVDPIPESVVMDAEKAFVISLVHGDDIDRSLVETIEKGGYLNPYELIDRFGYKLSMLYMSAGCRATLVVRNRPNLVINCIKARDSMLSEITKYCERRTIITPDR